MDLDQLKEVVFLQFKNINIYFIMYFSNDLAFSLSGSFNSTPFQ